MVAAAKSLQSCPTLCNPIDGSPRGSPVSGILQARILEWVAISFSNAWKWKVKVKSLSSVRLLATPWTAAYQAPPSMGFSRQEYWSGLPLPSPNTSICAILYNKITRKDFYFLLMSPRYTRLHTHVQVPFYQMFKCSGLLLSNGSNVPLVPSGSLWILYIHSVDKGWETGWRIRWEILMGQ